MGGSGGSSVLYQIEKLQRGELRMMGMHRLRTRSVPVGTDRHIPTIGVDCNMVINAVGRYKKDPVTALASYLEEWADTGFVILPVVDGCAPHAKLATIDHIAKRELDRAKAIETRNQLRAATQRLAKDPLTADERAKLITTCAGLGKRAKTLETRSTKIVPNDLAERLVIALERIGAHETHCSGGRVLHVQEAWFQGNARLNHLHSSGRRLC